MGKQDTENDDDLTPEEKAHIEEILNRPENQDIKAQLDAIGKDSSEFNARMDERRKEREAAFAPMRAAIADAQAEIDKSSPELNRLGRQIDKFQKQRIEDDARHQERLCTPTPSATRQISRIKRSGEEFAQTLDGTSDPNEIGKATDRFMAQTDKEDSFIGRLLPFSVWFPLWKIKDKLFG